ncbi:hypothetical protein NL676_021279 [Syzygium grande]|nr:hypothetical protein NL676_021279 [Syzygium grande]
MNIGRSHIHDSTPSHRITSPLWTFALKKAPYFCNPSKTSIWRKDAKIHSTRRASLGFSESPAMKVLPKDCSTLESRLCKHLLNWRRICNIARIPGDKVEDNVADLIGS